MHHWIKELDQITEAFRQHFGSLEAQALNWKPHPGSWSIAQNLDHLITINESYFPLMEQLKAGNYKLPFWGRFGFLTRFFGKFILNASQPDRKNKIKTFSIWEPDTSQIPGDIIDRFADHQEQLKKVIETSEDLIQQGAVIASPANGNIVYTLEAAFDIIVTHERRHLEQAKEVWMLFNEKQSPS